MLGKSEIAIPCECGRRTKKTVSWISSNNRFTCGCGRTIEIDASQFNQEMKKVNKAFSDLRRTIKRFGR